MSLRSWLAAPVIAATTLVPAVFPQSSAPRPLAEPAAVSGVSTLGDQVDLAVTVYNSDLALVRDTREITLPTGTSDLQFEDIAATVNPSTVHFRSLTDPSRVNVLEQNYEYDLLDPNKLLQKYVGRDVTLIRRAQAGGETRDEAVTARLLSFNGSPVWQIGNEIVTGMTADSIRFPELPATLHARPTLVWSLENDGAARHRVEASYLAGKLAWNADYVLTVAQNDKTADLDGWVTLTNGSGTAFRHASLQLVAGNLNRVREAFARDMPMDAISLAAPKAAPMAQEAFSDYHLYTLARKTTIENAETKQISMLTATRFPVDKRYVVNGQTYYYRNASPGAPTRNDVEVFYDFTNKAGNGLGMPLPAGVVRVYQADSHGGLQFAGEDRIDHTPKDETLSLKIGTAFDIIAERKQIDFQRIASNVYEVEYQVTIRNHKTQPVAVEVNEPIGGTWQVLRSTHAFTKTGAFAAQFMLPVAVNGATTLDYRVRVTY